MTVDKPGNPNIVEYGKGTHFGKEGAADAQAAQAKSRVTMKENSSIRRMVKRIAAHEFDVSEGAPPISDQIKAIFGKRKMTGAQMFAATRAAQAMKNYKAMQNLVEDVDGKLIEKKVEATVNYADLVSGSLQLEKDDTFVTGDNELEEGSREPDTLET